MEVRIFRLRRALGLIFVFVLCAVNRSLFSAPDAKISEKEKHQVGDRGQMAISDIAEKHVKKFTLKNGMTVLVRPESTIPKVSLQLWYNVGSKDEGNGERGIAHLIEHMIFKGTKKLSESDINVITHMLSGNCNAFTSYDFTGYLFNLPSHNWKEVLPIMADCMENCSFKEDMLSSEMKAVIQELKMYKDNYVRSLIDDMISAIFADHPYHHPIIGYKQDLWSVSSDDLKLFYKKHYKPNNATLVIVGDVDPDDALSSVERHFGSIKSDPNYKKDEHYFNQDIASKSITLYRDIKQPVVILSFVIPGAKHKNDHTVSLVEYVLGKGKSSRLYKKIVDELQLATSLTAGSEELFDHGLLFIIFEPKDIASIEAIQKHIEQELELIAQKGIDDQEVSRAINQTKMGLYGLLEDTESQAFEIGKYFLATGDENYVFNYLAEPADQLKKRSEHLIAAYLRPTVMHKGMILPLPEREKAEWAKLQAVSDQEDERILAGRVRTTEVEPISYAKKIKKKDFKEFKFPKSESFMLSNGAKILHYHNGNTPKINICIDFVAKSYYDPDDKQGLHSFMSKMLTEGTQNYTAQGLADLIESRGMSINVHPGSISLSMLNEDFELGLHVLEEIVTKAVFNEREIEKIRQQMLSDLKSFWDEPRSFSGQLIRQELYRGHPYQKIGLGTQESIKSITRKELVDFYKKHMTPQGAKIAIVGDIKSYGLKETLEKALGAWRGESLKKVEFPKLSRSVNPDVEYPINRDQVVLCFAGLSIDRKDPDYDKLLLFDQIFGGGALGSMSSRLFELRERSGLFYTISGSLVAGSNEQPGMVLVKTIVSLDRLKEAETAIRDAIDTAAQTIAASEFDEAKRAIMSSLLDNFASNEGIAHVFLFLDRYGFSKDFFDKRADQLASIKIEDVQKVVKKVLDSKQLMTFRIGRVGAEVEKQMVA